MGSIVHGKLNSHFQGIETFVPVLECMRIDEYMPNLDYCDAIRSILAFSGRSEAIRRHLALFRVATGVLPDQVWLLRTLQIIPKQLEP